MAFPKKFCTTQTCLLLGGIFPFKALAVVFSATPLNVPTNPPANVLFSISNEFPSGSSSAYGYSPFDSTTAYDGYFDPNKCYDYVVGSATTIPTFNQNPGDAVNSITSEYFTPAFATSSAYGYACSGPLFSNSPRRAWSGSFLNWLTMTNMDIFRKSLTGGTRHIDTPTQTRLLRSWVDAQASHTSNFPDQTIPNVPAGSNPLSIRDYTPITYASSIGTTKIKNIVTPSVDNPNVPGYQWVVGDHFTIVGTLTGNYDSTNLTNPYNTPRISVVVCSPTVSLESNCKPYYKDTSGTQYYKPTGLIQQYQNMANFGAFSYALDNQGGSGGTKYHAGGVMREALKSVGGTSYQSNSSIINNAASEIDPNTGIFIFDPDSTPNVPNSDTPQSFPRSTSVADPIDYLINGIADSSGLINFINQFGYVGINNLNTPQTFNYPQADTVAELYYETLRYLALPYNGGTKNATPEYTYDLVYGASSPFNDVTFVDDGFPVITSYSDPILDKCQKNSIVFIGDANTVCDSRIPGGTVYGVPSKCGSSVMTPSNPIPNLNVQLWVTILAAYENGYTDLIYNSTNLMNCPTGGSTSGRGCYKSDTPNIAGLAYWAHVNNIRPDLAGFVNVSSYFFDVHEGKDRSQNGVAPYQYGNDPTHYWLAAKYGGFTFSNGDSINPNTNASTWNTSGTGVPNNFMMGIGSSSIQTTLSKMFTTLIDTKVRQSNGHIAISNPINPQSTQIYKTYYSSNGSNQWEGNIIIGTPTVSTTNGVNSYNTGNTPTDFTQGAAKWLVDNTVNGQPRQIITAIRASTGSAISGSALQWGSLGAYIRGKFKNHGDSSTLGNQRMDYVRGDRSNEFSTANPGGIFRTRPLSVLGDIIDSSPVYVAGAMSGYSDSDFPSGTPSYTTYAQSIASRRPMLYVGANDGMLHGFDATTLQEVFAYVPNSVHLQFRTFPSPAYTHNYFVDETPIVAEVPVSGTWKTELIGFTGQGGSGLFALDISSPDNARPNVNLSNAESNANNILLWELNSESDPDIGNILNRGQVNNQKGGLSRQVGQMSNGRWAVITGNGYNSPNNSSGLLVVYLDSSGGTPSYKKIMIPGATGGLSTPTPVDSDLDGIIDYAYAGDLQGNLWRFDLHGPDTQWSAVRLFQAQDPTLHLAQPIVTGPTVTFHCSKPGLMVIFGTGTYFQPNDNGSYQTQSLYGLWDPFDNLFLQSSSNKFVTQSVSTSAYQNPNQTPTLAGRNLTITTDWGVDWTWQRGWIMNLPGSNDRIVVPPYVINDLVYFNTTTPSFPSCSEGQLLSTSQALESCTGQRPHEGVFDTNFDGSVNQSDQVNWYGTMINVSGMHAEDQGRIYDPSVWINPIAFQCATPPCNTLQTAFSEPFGISIGIGPPKRMSWRQISQ